MAKALGVPYLRADGRLILEPLCGGLLREGSAIDPAGLHPALAHCTIEVACDVDDPVLGT